MTDQTRGITVRILDKEFQIACPTNQEASLLEAADFLTDKMIKIRKSGRVIGIERIAIMAALNLAHELLEERREKPAQATQNMVQETAPAMNTDEDRALTDRLLNLHRKLDTALANEKLEESYS